MQDFLVMRDFGKTKPPTVDKVRRDGENMYCESRYVIVLNEDGVVVETIDRKTEYTGNFLVVLAPVTYNGEFLPLCVVLEIGLSRSVPYQQFEKKFKDRKKISIQKRRTVVTLSEKATISFLPLISSSLQDIVDEDISHRKSLIWQTRASKKDGKQLRSGKFVTLSTEAEMVVFIFLEADLRHRTNGHLSLFVKLTKEKLDSLPYAYYPNKELKRLKVAKDIAYVLGEANYPSHFVDAIRKKLGKETTKYRALFEQIIEVFKISFHSGNENDLLHKELSEKFSASKDELVNLTRLSVMVHPKRDKARQIHAKNCIRVEVFPSKEAVLEKHPELIHTYKT